MTLAALTASAHRTHAPHPAVLTDGEALTFAQLGAQARSVAHGLAARGLRRGDRVVLALDNRPEVLALEHGLWLGGFVRVAVSPRLHPEEVAAITADCSAAALVGEPAFARAPAPRVLTPGPDLDALLHGPQLQRPETGAADDLVALMYTSGSTGAPKGAPVTSGAWTTMLQEMWRALPPLGPGDVVLHAAPMSHFGGSVGSACTLAGAAALPVRRLEAADVARHRVSVLPLVPTMLTRLLDAAGGADLSSLRAVVYGAAPATTALLTRAREALGDVLHQFYGLSEALAPLTVLTPADHAAGGARLASVGRPVGSVDLRVVAEDGTPLPPGRTGQVVVAGPQVMTGYWPGRRGPGGFATGDLGSLDADGYLHLVGRANDVIVTGGSNVHPAEVEEAIARLPGVVEVAVCGVPDPVWGETVAAVVVGDVTEEDVRRACAERLASYKKPRRVVLADALPRGGTGKTDRRRVRHMLTEGEQS